MGGEEERWTEGGAPGSGDQGKHRGCFPCTLGPWETSWAPGPGPLFSGAPSGLVGARGMGGREEGEEEERRTVGGGPSRTTGSGAMLQVFPPPTWAPGSLLGFWDWCPAFWGPLRPRGS